MQGSEGLKANEDSTASVEERLAVALTKSAAAAIGGKRVGGPAFWVGDPAPAELGGDTEIKVAPAWQVLRYSWLAGTESRPHDLHQTEAVTTGDDYTKGQRPATRQPTSSVSALHWVGTYVGELILTDHRWFTEAFRVIRPEGILILSFAAQIVDLAEIEATAIDIASGAITLRHLEVLNLSHFGCHESSKWVCLGYTKLRDGSAPSRSEEETLQL